MDSPSPDGFCAVLVKAAESKEVISDYSIARVVQKMGWMQVQMTAQT
jgi:hypothetical protein